MVAARSRLEGQFEFLWRALDGPPLKREYRFRPARRWRADFAHLSSRTLIEIEGGVWVGDRHNRGSGFSADAEKYFEATLAGRRVIRLTSQQLESDTIERIVLFCAT